MVDDQCMDYCFNDVWRINPHPHIVRFDNAVPVMEVGKDKPTMYLIFEYLHKTLGQVVDEIGFLKDDIPHFLYQILSGVDHCHSFSVIHRDLKPKNILFDENNRTLKIADFGSGHSFTVGPEGSNYYPEVMASIKWKAPELLLLTGKYSSPVDIWSVGLIFALMARGGKNLVSATDRFSQLVNIFHKCSHIIPGRELQQKKLWIMYTLRSMTRLRRDHNGESFYGVEILNEGVNIRWFYFSFCEPHKQFYSAQWILNLNHSSFC